MAADGRTENMFEGVNKQQEERMVGWTLLLKLKSSSLMKADDDGKNWRRAVSVYACASHLLLIIIVGRMDGRTDDTETSPPSFCCRLLLVLFDLVSMN
jgi:hypothetical protein